MLEILKRYNVYWKNKELKVFEKSYCVTGEVVVPTLYSNSLYKMELGARLSMDLFVLHSLTKLLAHNPNLTLTQNFIHFLAWFIVSFFFTIVTRKNSSIRLTWLLSVFRHTYIQSLGRTFFVVNYHKK